MSSVVRVLEEVKAYGVRSAVVVGRNRKPGGTAKYGVLIVQMVSGIVWE